MPNALLIFENPYTNADVESNDFLISPFTQADGLFLPVLAGGVSVSASSFAGFYLAALAAGDIKLLKTPIFPYFVNALHFFALSANTEGIAFCFKH